MKDITASSQSRRNLTKEVQRCRTFGLDTRKSPRYRQLKRQVKLDEELETRWKRALSELLHAIAWMFALGAAFGWLNVIAELYVLLQQ